MPEILQIPFSTHKQDKYDSQELTSQVRDLNWPRKLRGWVICNIYDIHFRHQRVCCRLCTIGLRKWDCRMWARLRIADAEWMDSHVEGNGWTSSWRMYQKWVQRALPRERRCRARLRSSPTWEIRSRRERGVLGSGYPSFGVRSAIRAHQAMK